ncbi:cellulase (glycosyl hydrolase family 5) subfamily protein [Acanthamoeba castellanii str. Neff]|uniref:Cellulase (Glycosyl hydrolase family 5) subfamily protein n=1 Tax=Acanthamoeba castellanii (strain ATCC 30010 / Neff) TaxID=1257118 RepID=L8GMH1_ACACF|nr:cellulase (glycosyl hydrolase family 5) subfamily protein [Acanthamoeba castellanii str. Neff]ELR13416.1 cellulase (glycosyl hydrolase family 5) subfamily protein [Acanthamoeba castellanii str. Neff]
MNGQAWLMWACALALASIVFMSAPTVGQSTCYAPTALNFTSEAGKLWVNGQRFHLKGTSWFGFETAACTVHGLWANSYTFFLDFLAAQGFNAIRLPFHLELVLNEKSPNGINYGAGANADLQGLNSLQVMDKVIQGAAARGIVVMLDLHSFAPDQFMSDGLWYNGANPESKVIAGWTKLLQRYKNQWNVVAADLKNEPHSSTWGTGNTATDWNLGAARLANAIASAVSDRFLMFVEGVSNSPPCRENCFWGENLTGARTNPVVIDHPAKLVYSPHVYGPNVFGQSYFSAGNFPANMPAIWEDHWGFIPAATDRAFVIGEWGGPFSGKDRVWMEALAAYLKTKDSTGQFFWCLNPNSGDTGGLLKDDWSSPDSGKLALLADLVSAPTKFAVNAQGQVCINGGNQPAPSGSASPAAPKPSASSSAAPSASSSPAAPKPSASSSPAAPKASASASPAAPQPSASSSPAAPKASASASPAAPQPSASSSPAAPRPSASSSPAAPSNPPTTGGFSFYVGTSAWWVAVTIPGSESVSIDCGNGQGLVVMTPAWLPHMWTFTSTNGHACKSSLTFVVNGGAPQTITSPWA